MKIYISTFSNIRNFKPNMIPISTALGWPWWLYKSSGYNIGTYYIDKNNIMIGISDDRLHFPKEQFEQLDEPCQKNCPYIDKAPNCQFMTAYYNHLSSLPFNDIIKEFEETAEEVRKATHYEGEPIIVLLVYESPKCKCAERPCLQKWFADNNYELKELE